MSIPAETIDRIQHLSSDQATVVLDLIAFYEQQPAKSHPETFINRIGDVIVITPLNKAKEVFLNSFDMFSDDYMEDGRPSETDSVRAEL